MHRKATARTASFHDFNQGCGMQLDPGNEWVVLAEAIDWAAMEDVYAELFPSRTGRPAKPLRMALGSLVIQKRKGLTDRGLVAEVAENPYLQYFVGMAQSGSACPFSAPALVEFRKRMGFEFVNRINEMPLEGMPATPGHTLENAGGDNADMSPVATCIVDAACSPASIRHPQDSSLPDEARARLEGMIDRLHETHRPRGKPRDCRRVARGEYLAMAKAKGRPAKKPRAHIRRELGRVRRDLGYVERRLKAGYALPESDEPALATMREPCAQQKRMFEDRTHRVEDRTVSVSEPWVRPIARGKAETPVGFGAKYDAGIDEPGHARLERASFDAYSESSCLVGAVERRRQRTGHYPKRVLADQICRTRDNRAYCKEHGVALSGPGLGRPAKDAEPGRRARQDETGRIEVERFFGRSKRRFGAGLVTCKLEETQLCSIALSVLAANPFALPAGSFFVLLAECGCRQPQSFLMELYGAA